MALSTRNVILAGAALLGSLALATGSQAARNYDCTKPGNANKAVCKAAAPPPASDKPAAATAAVAHTPPAMKAAAAAPAPVAAGNPPRVVAYTEKNGKVVHYDCSKKGNLNKKACKAG